MSAMSTVYTQEQIDWICERYADMTNAEMLAAWPWAEEHQVTIGSLRAFAYSRHIRKTAETLMRANSPHRRNGGRKSLESMGELCSVMSDWEVEEAYLLRKRGTTMQQLAREHGVCTRTLTSAFKRLERRNGRRTA